jgi:hypothetical protein
MGKVLLLLGLFIAGSVVGQNLDSLQQKKGVTLSGGVSVNSIIYASSQINSGRPPLNFYTTGNLNVDLFGVVNVPLTFAFSNQNSSFRQPFNQFVFRPTYRGFTLQAGVGSMIFNPYTLAGHRFKGVGLEYRSAKSPLWFGLMYGNLRDAVADDSLQPSAYSQASYRRKGWGVRLGYEVLGAQIEGTLFRATDIINSIPTPSNESYLVPEENVAWSLRASRQFFNRLRVQVDYATSLLTTDKRSPEVPDSTRQYGATFFGLIQPRLSTEIRRAYKVSVVYTLTKLNLGLEMEHVDPYYRTLGGYYFINDIENYTTSITTQLFKGQVGLTASGGLQRDNLDQSKSQTQHRFIGQIALAVAPSTKSSINLNYSNFTACTNVRSDFERLTQLTTYNSLDTLNYRQISQNLTASMVQNLSKVKEVQKTIMMTLLYQTSHDYQGVETTAKSVLYNGSVGYIYGLANRGITINSVFYVNGTSVGDQILTAAGPAVTFRKTSGERLAFTGNVLYSRSSAVATTPAGQVLSLRSGLAFTASRDHQLTADVVYLWRRYDQVFSEATFTIGYTYRIAPVRLGQRPSSSSATAPTVSRP